MFFSSKTRICCGNNYEQSLTLNRRTPLAFDNLIQLSDSLFISLPSQTLISKKQTNDIFPSSFVVEKKSNASTFCELNLEQQREQHLVSVFRF